jgi:hypothetical protein
MAFLKCISYTPDTYKNIGVVIEGHFNFYSAVISYPATNYLIIPNFQTIHKDPEDFIVQFFEDLQTYQKDQVMRMKILECFQNEIITLCSTRGS